MNKKLSQLTEKVTSLSADDLLLVSTGGISKSIKASTLEAPLKAYADQKKSEVVSELSTLDSALSSEITNRQAADTNTLNSAKSYTDSQISSEVSARNAADVSMLNSAKAYTDAEILEKITSVNAADTAILNSAKAYTDSSIQVEVSNRQASNLSTLNSAKSYTDAEILKEVSARNAADTSTLNSAKAYTDAEMLKEVSARNIADLNTLNAAKAYTNSSLQTEITNRQAADTDAINTAKAYTDSIASALEISIQLATGTDYGSDIQALQAAILAEETSRVSAIGFIESSIQSVVTNSIVPIQGDVTTLFANLNKEITDRSAGDTSTLNSAKSYTDTQMSTEVSARSAGDTSTLNAAKAYTDSTFASVSPSGTSVPVGVIQMYAGITAPTGWLLCDGSAVSRTTQSALFSVIGTSYGAGNGSTTFNLPNPDTNANLRLIIKV